MQILSVFVVAFICALPSTRSDSTSSSSESGPVPYDPGCPDLDAECPNLYHSCREGEYNGVAVNVLCPRTCDTCEGCETQSFKDLTYDPNAPLPGDLPVQPQCGKTGDDISVESGSSSKREVRNVQQKRIVGGQESQLGQWPWMVALGATLGGTSYLQYCGASLIAPNWVLTAAHCVAPQGMPCNYFARLGEHSLSGTTENHVDIAAEKIFQHPNFSYAAMSIYDVALIKLRRPAPINEYINTVCLPDVGFTLPSGTEVQIAGWGDTDPDPSTFDYSDTLRHVTLKTISTDDCNTTTEWSGLIFDGIFCAGYPPVGGKSTCFRDSGGPLVYQEEDGTYVQVGISIAGSDECGKPGEPGTFVDVAHPRIMHWIESTIRTHGLN